MTQDELNYCKANGYSEKYSFSHFVQRRFNTATDMNNITIFRSNFSQEEPDTVVFPPGVVGLKLQECNLDNCVIPPGATVIDHGGTHGSRRRYKVQNDGRDWEVDAQNKPVKLVSEKREIAMGRSIDPKDIPSAGAVAALRAQAIAKVTAKGRVPTFAERQLAETLLFSPDDMTPDKIAERKARGAN